MKKDIMKGGLRPEKHIASPAPYRVAARMEGAVKNRGTRAIRKAPKN